MHKVVKVKNNTYKFKKELFFFLSFCLVYLFGQNAFCYTLSSTDLNKIIYNKINLEAKKYLGDTEYKINIYNTFSQDILTNETAIPLIEISSINDFAPVSYRRITIKDSKGNLVKTIPVNVHILIYKNVLTAVEDIPYSKTINASNTKTERKEVSKYYDKVLCDLPENTIASRNIAKGSIIQKNSIKQKAIIEKNQNVDIVFQGRGIQVALKGKALKEGIKGETILVRSDKYNKTYTGTVDSSSKVTVRI